MSHNVTIKNVKVQSLKHLAGALAELNREQKTNYELVTTSGAMGRGWAGANKKFDAVIRNPHGQYDLGLNKQTDGTYLFEYEDMAGSDFARHLGAQQNTVAVDKTKINTRDPQSYVGRLVQRMNVIGSEEQARLKGHSTQRVTDPKTGQMSLIATVH